MLHQTVLFIYYYLLIIIYLLFIIIIVIYYSFIIGNINKFPPFAKDGATNKL